MDFRIYVPPFFFFPSTHFVSCLFYVHHSKLALLIIYFQQDIDCMPLNPLENIPTLLARHIALDRFFENFNELRTVERAKASPGGEVDNFNGLSHSSPSTYPVTNLLKQTKVCHIFLYLSYVVKLILRMV